MGKRKNYANKTQIIKRIRSLQKRTIPTRKFYEQFTVEDLKRIRNSAKLDNDMWLFDLAKMNKRAKAKKQ